MSICYDLRFPEEFRIQALRGATVVTLPSAFTAPTGKDHWEPLLRARAIENQVFVIAPDQRGASTPKLQWHGRSMIVDPWGVVLAQAPDTECFITADLDLAAQTGRAHAHPEPRRTAARRPTTGRRNDDRRSQISCAFPPGPDVVEHAQRRRGARLRAGVALRLARARTPTSGSRSRRSPSTPSGWRIGPAVLVPGLRHPLTQASAIATLEALAPGRVVVAIGTGFTGRMALGQRAMPWADTRTYIAQVRGLLEGEAMVIDGAVVKMIPPDGYLPAAPDLGADPRRRERAEGLRGRARARRRRDEHLRRATPSSSGARCSRSAPCSTRASRPDSERAFAAAGPALTVVYHGMYESRPGARRRRCPAGPSGAPSSSRSRSTLAPPRDSTRTTSSR